MAGSKHTALSSQHSVHGKPGSTTVGRSRKPKRKSKTNTRKRSKARRPTWRNDDEQVTIFPEVKGKVVREVMFSHEDTENVLVIDFDDRTALSFQIYPEPMVLPVDIQAHYMSQRRSADKTWEGLAGKSK